jgi:hypothetical protein
LEISEKEFKEVKKIIKELNKDVQHLPNITNDIINTNIHYRAYLLNQFIENVEMRIENEIKWWDNEH